MQRGLQPLFTPRCVLCLDEGIVLDKTDQFGCVCRENRFHGLCWDSYVLHHTDTTRCPCCRALIKHFQPKEYPLQHRGESVTSADWDRIIDGLYLCIGAGMIGMGLIYDNIPQHAPWEVVYPSVILTFIYYVCGMITLCSNWITHRAVLDVYQHGFNSIVMMALWWTNCLGYYWVLATWWGVLPLICILIIVIVAIAVGGYDTIQIHRHAQHPHHEINR